MNPHNAEERTRIRNTLMNIRSDAFNAMIQAQQTRRSYRQLIAYVDAIYTAASALYETIQRPR